MLEPLSLSLVCVYVCFSKKKKNAYVSILLDKYTYKIIILYIAKLNLIFMIFFTNLLLCLSLARLLVESKFEFELDLFVKRTYKQVFSQVEFELCINSLIHL